MSKTLIIFALLLGTTCFAQVEQGDINLSGSVTFTSTDGTNSGLIFGKGGYYITQHIEAGSLVGVFLSEFTAFIFGPYGTYNFLTQDAKLMPYAGGQVLVFATEGFSFTSFGLYGGAKYFVTEAVNVDAGLSLLTGDSGTTVAVTVGLGFVIGKLR
jgi:hypothetical protein